MLSGLSWSVSAGRSVILGPNGAGKTTLLKLGAGVLGPHSGGVHSSDKSLSSAVGWMPQDIKALAGLTAREQVSYSAWMKGASRGDAWVTAEQALDDVGLGDQVDEKTSRLSGGQRRRVGLAQALSSAPDILLLDEPTAGLDPAQRSRFREILKSLPREITVVVSTHQVDDLQDIFDVVMVMSLGRFVWQGTVDDFMSLGSHDPRRQGEAAYEQILGGDH